MPYIKQDRRKNFYDGRGVPYSPGELNFLFSTIVAQYLEEHGTSYQTINDIVGALEGAKLEFYRRIAAPYEDGKIQENGDVY